MEIYQLLILFLFPTIIIIVWCPGFLINLLGSLGEEWELSLTAELILDNSLFLDGTLSAFTFYLSLWVRNRTHKKAVSANPSTSFLTKFSDSA